MEKKFDVDVFVDSGLGNSFNEEGNPVTYQLEQLHLDNEDKHELEDDFSFLFEQDDDGDNYLHIAICNKDEDTALQIINASSSVSQLNLKNNIGQTPVLLAVICQLPKVVEYLMSKDVDLDAVDYGTMNNLLHIAAENRDSLIIKLICCPENLTASANYSVSVMKDMMNDEGLTPLHIAVKNQDISSIQVLICCGADVEIKDATAGYTALHHAVLTGNANFVKHFIIISHPFIDSVCYSGWTPYWLATINQLIDIQTVLKDAGAETQIVENIN